MPKRFEQCNGALSFPNATGGLSTAEGQKLRLRFFFAHAPWQD